MGNPISMPYLAGLLYLHQQHPQRAGRQFLPEALRGPVSPGPPHSSRGRPIPAYPGPPPSKYTSHHYHQRQKEAPVHASLPQGHWQSLSKKPISTRGPGEKVLENTLSHMPSIPHLPPRGLGEPRKAPSTPSNNTALIR